MSRGGYIGGHTIINTKSKKSRKRTQKHIQHDLLYSVITSELNGIPVKRLPKDSGKSLSVIIEKSGGILNWARSHPDYQKIKESTQKKLINVISSRRLKNRENTC